MPVAIVAAHPDDETIGLATALPKLRKHLTVIHVTDGAPRSGPDASNAGCATWQEYAALRRRELANALAMAGADSATTLCLDCPDQQASFCIGDHAVRLAQLFRDLRPSFVFTHPYEGGHPDHDATAAAVHAGLVMSEWPCALLEFASYHAGIEGIECERFIGGPTETWARPLSPEKGRWKRKLLDCFASQKPVLEQFPLQSEPLRLAPRYDFSRSPHAGSLYYERFDWGLDGEAWRRCASEAFCNLGLPCVC